MAACVAELLISPMVRVGRCIVVDRRLFRSRTTSRRKPDADEIHSDWLTTSQKQPACAETPNVATKIQAHRLCGGMRLGLYRHHVLPLPRPGPRPAWIQ